MGLTAQINNRLDNYNYLVSTIPARIKNLPIGKPMPEFGLGRTKVDVRGQSAVYLSERRRRLLLYVNWTYQKDLEKAHELLSQWVRDSDIQQMYGPDCEDFYQTHGFTVVAEDRFMLRYLSRKPNVFLISAD